MTGSPLLPLVGHLDHALSALQRDPTQEAPWQVVATAATTIADALRTRNGPVDNHTELGQSSLPISVSTLLSLATPAPNRTPLSAPAASATFELLRVGANLCSNHDLNRQALLDAGAPSTVAEILDAYWRQVSKGNDFLVNGAVEHLKIIKTAIGFLLNASVGFDPVRALLIARKTPLTILNLSTAIYTPGAWASATAASLDEWKLRSGLSAWSWQAIETFGADEDVEDEEQPAEGSVHKATPIFDADAIPAIISALKPFASSNATAEDPPFSPSDRQEFVRADTQVLSHVSMLLESLCIDSDSARQALVYGNPPPLLTVLDFVEKAAPPSFWNSNATKSLSVCKAAIIKGVVMAAGDDGSMATLWGSASGSTPGGWFVGRMVEWIRTASTSTPTPGLAAEERDDLIICATLSLGNLARRPAHCVALLSPPLSLTEYLLPFLAATVDIKVKHGVLGLLKHLAQPPQNKDILGSAGFIEALALSKIWQREGDIAEVVQNSAIGVAKHLSYYNAANALKLVHSPPADPVVDSPLDQILDLVRRSDTISLQSEGTRVLVNVIKGLFSMQTSGSGANGAISTPISAISQGPPVDPIARQEAIKKIATIDSAEPLAEMIGRSAKYPILLNEAVVSLTLLSSQAAGLSAVLQALVTPLPYHILPSGMATAQAPSLPRDEASEPNGHTKSTSQPLDVLVAILKNTAGTFPPELGANVCTLLSSLGKGNQAEVEPVKAKMTPVLDEILASRSNSGGSATLLQSAVERTVNTWKQSASV